MNRIRHWALMVLVAAVVAVNCSTVFALDLKSPENNAALDTTKPNLSWSKVDKAKVYQLLIFDFKTFKMVYQRFIPGTSHTVEKGLLKKGKSYSWVVKARESLSKSAFDTSDRWKFTIGSSTSAAESGGTFERTGYTIVVPVEFKSHKFKGDPVAVVTKKMNQLVEYYRVISYNAERTMQEVTFDVAPGVFLNENRNKYSADKQDSGKNWMRDCGDFGRSWAGAHQMKKIVLPHVFKAGVPVKEYRHIIYVVPEGGGNSWGSDQFWPASTGGRPSGIKFDEKRNVVSGSYSCGIVMGIGVSTGTYSHEFGHQLGLPDLYPYSNSPKRDLGYSALMAAGNQIGQKGVNMFVLSRKKEYSGSGLKQDWIQDKLKVLKKSETIWLESRTSKGEIVGVVIPDTSTSNKEDHYVIEVFDRKSVDKDFVGFFQGLKGRESKANVAVFISFVDNLDVNRIKVAQGVPASKSRKQNFFLSGGEYKKGNFAVNIGDVKDLGDRWAARISVTIDGQAPQGDPEPPIGRKDDDKKIAEEKKRQDEETKKRETEDKKRVNELKKKVVEEKKKGEEDEARRKKEEEMEKQLDEYQQLLKDQNKWMEKERKQLEEEKLRLEEQLKKMKEEEEKRKQASVLGWLKRVFGFASAPR